MAAVLCNSRNIQQCFPVKRQKDMQSKIKFHFAILEVHGGHLQITMVKIVNLSFAIIFLHSIPISKTKNKKHPTNKQSKKNKTKQKEKSDLKKVNQPIH